MPGILTIQIKSVTKDKKINFRKVEHFVKANAKKPLDLVVLPEFFATNCDYLNSIEPEDGGETIEFAKRLAIEYKTNIIAGSVVRQKNGKLYNTSFAINRAGNIIQTYDKIHLYNYLGGSEGERINAGENIAIAEFDFARVGMAICFDIRFPGHFTQLIKQNVDIIVLPTAWLVPKEVFDAKDSLNLAKEMWMAICKTRAYDNGVYFVISNQTKEAPNENYGLGNSMIIAPNAQILAHIDEKEGGAYSQIDLQLVKYLQQLFPLAKLS